MPHNMAHVHSFKARMMRMNSILPHLCHIQYQKVVKVSKQKYSILQLSIDHVETLLGETEANMSSKEHLSMVPIISCRLRVDEVKSSLHTADFERKGYPVVLPCQVTESGLLCVPREFNDYLRQLKGLLENRPFLENSKSPCFDIEAQSSRDESPIVIAMQMYSGLSERKLRRLGIPELLKRISDAFEHQDSTETSNVFLIMREIDIGQCGLYGMGSIEKNWDGFVKIRVPWQTWQAKIKTLTCIDDIFYDLLIPGSDYVLYPKGIDRNLNFPKIYENRRQIAKKCNVDSQCLRQIIEDAISPYEDAISPYEDADDGKCIDKNEKRKAVDETVQFLTSLVRNGAMNDIPRKIVHDFRWTYHLVDEGNGRFRSFRRKVKKLTKAGYLVRRSSHWMWIAIAIGIIIPIAYGLGRMKSEATIEDIISTGAALVALYIGIASPILFQTAYQGEKLSHILTNHRHIDSQEEFDNQQMQQFSDIIEVIGISQNPPRFFGGENMNYLRKGTQEELLDSKNPIRFPNLDLLGFSLYETENGELYMLDKWSNLFKVVIGEIDDDMDIGNPKNKNASVSNYFTLEFMIKDIRKEVERGSWRSDVAKEKDENLYLFCKMVENTYRQRVSNDRRSLQISFDECGEERTIALYRLLPYGKRNREFQVRSWRLFSSINEWRTFSNAEIFDMRIGKYLNEDKKAL